MGPNVRYMKTDQDSYVNQLPKPYSSEVGIIAGIRGRKNGYNLFMKGDNDGRIKPERTRLGMEKDFICVKGQHEGLLRKKYVCQLVVRFLKSGSFGTKENH